MTENMRQHEDHEAVLAYGQKYLFCSDFGFTKQISTRADGRFCLINPHNPHVLRIVTCCMGENMRIMRIHEEGLFNGFYLPCVYRGVAGHPKHEADMRQHEADPHVLGGHGWVTAYPTLSFNSSTYSWRWECCD